MSLEITAIPLSFIAGGLGVLSPCVWPLIPIVMGSAAQAGQRGALYLAGGLSLSFALSGTVLSFVLLNLGLDPEFFRYVAASLLVIAAILLIHQPLGEWVSIRLSSLTARFNPTHDAQVSAKGQFWLGALLGLVWLPCVGPTLGAAIALASMGQDMLTAFLVMLSFGAGTALVLLIAALLSSQMLKKLSPQLMNRTQTLKHGLGWLLLLLGLTVLLGWDKQVEAWAITWLPAWGSDL
jgi:cytochrome c-type biogenesis protein